jgi:hypothetical protein
MQTVRLAVGAVGLRHDPARQGPRSQTELLLYLDQNYLSGIVTWKVAFRELEPTLGAAGRARGASPAATTN